MTWRSRGPLAYLAGLSVDALLGHADRSSQERERERDYQLVLALEIAAKWHKADVLKADPDVRLSA